LIDRSRYIIKFLRAFRRVAILIFFLGHSSRTQKREGNSTSGKSPWMLIVYAFLADIALVIWTSSEFFSAVEHQELALVLLGLTVICFTLYGVSKLISEHSLSTRSVTWTCVGCWLFCLFTAAIFVSSGNKFLERQRLSRLSDFLKPANDVTPNWADKELPNDGSLKIFIGGCLLCAPSNSLTHIARSCGRNLLDISCTKNGVALSGEFFDKDGKIVAVLETNAFTINPNNYFKMERPDRSTLLVRDQSNSEVLNVRWLNQYAISFCGVIRSPDGSRLVVSKTSIFMPEHTNIFKNFACWFQYSDSGFIDFSRTNVTWMF